MDFIKTTRKVWWMFTSKQRNSSIILFFLMFIGMFLEIMGIGLILPALALITQNDLASKYPFIISWLELLDNPSREFLVIFIMLLLVSVYIFKMFFLMFFAWRQASFIADVHVDLSQRLFTGYLKLPYTFHLQRNSAELIRNTTAHAGVAGTVITYSSLLIMEVLVLVGISTMLIIAEPLGAVITMLFFGVTGWCFTRVTRKHLLRWGEAAHLHDGLRMQHLQQGLGAAKEVKLSGRENEFLKQYKFHNENSARTGMQQTSLGAVPRLVLELFAVSSLASLVFVMISQGKSVESLLPIIGLFAAAAFRILPSVNRLVLSVNDLRFRAPVINTMYEELLLINTIEPPTYSGELILKNKLVLDHLEFNYPVSERTVLKGISFTIVKGKTFGFVGESGAGKSTLIDVVLGLLTPVVGSVKVDDIDIQTNIRGWQNQIGYVSQTIYLTDDSLRKNIAFGLPDEEINDDAVWRSIRSAQLEQFIKDLPEGLNTVVGERGIRLSGGQRQRIGIARALYHEPSVLVLDEATSSLDTITERGVMNAIRDLHGKKTILIVAHRLSTVEDCDFIYRLEQGVVVETGRPKDVIYKTVSNN